MPYIKVNNINIYYEVLGRGEPLVFILGLSTDLSEWGYFINKLAEQYKVLVFDNRGCGRSDKPNIPYSIEIMASDTAELMKSLGFNDTNVIGLSMGGRIALDLSLKYPELVK